MLYSIVSHNSIKRFIILYLGMIKKLLKAIFTPPNGIFFILEKIDDIVLKIHKD